MSFVRPIFFALALVVVPTIAYATGFEDADREPIAGEPFGFDAWLRARGAGLYNFDLDRGLDANGRPLFPVPVSGKQTTTAGDVRLRGDAAFASPGGTVAIKARFDVLGASSERTIPEPVRDETRMEVRRIYGEAILPFGAIIAGRTGSHWGLGILANGGDCADCDGGDAADRVAFVTPLAGHLWAAAFDLGSASVVEGIRADFPRDDSRALTFAVLRWKDRWARDRRRGAGKTTLEYGALVSHSWEDREGGLRATALDGWGRVSFPYGRIEAEGAFLAATLGQPSLIPGVLMRDHATSRQGGAALETSLDLGRFSTGIDGGWASGDTDPDDLKVDAYRFHSDYHVDRILFREVLGTVGAAAYIRPHVSLRFGSVHTSLAAVASRAVYARSAPGGEAPLGIEIDPTITWSSPSGLDLALEHAVLFPLAGLDNPDAGMKAMPAQMIRLRIDYRIGARP